MEKDQLNRTLYGGKRGKEGSRVRWGNKFIQPLTNYNGGELMRRMSANEPILII